MSTKNLVTPTPIFINLGTFSSGPFANMYTFEITLPSPKRVEIRFRANFEIPLFIRVQHLHRHVHAMHQNHFQHLQIINQQQGSGQQQFGSGTSICEQSFSPVTKFQLQTCTSLCCMIFNSIKFFKQIKIQYLKGNIQSSLLNIENKILQQNQKILMQLQRSLPTITESRCQIKISQLSDLIQIQKGLYQSEDMQLRLQVANQIKQLQVNQKLMSDVEQIFKCQNLTFEYLQDNFKELKYQLTMIKDNELMFEIFRKYGLARQSAYYFEYMKNLKDRSNPMGFIFKPASLMKKKMKELKSTFLKSLLKNHSQSKQITNQFQKNQHLLLENDSEKQYMILHEEINIKQKYSIKLKKLKECRWVIYNYSLVDLKEVIDELKEAKEAPFLQIQSELRFRFNQLNSLKLIERCVTMSLRAQSQSIRAYKNFIQINKNLKVKYLSQKGQYKKIQEVLKIAQKKKQLEMQNALKEIVFNEQNKIPKSTQQQQALFDFFKKDQIDLITCLKLCRSKLYFLSIEHLMEIQKQISKRQQNGTLEIRAFIAHRITQLRKKHQDVRIITQILLLTKLVQEKIIAEGQQYRALLDF